MPSERTVWLVEFVRPVLTSTGAVVLIVPAERLPPGKISPLVLSVPALKLRSETPEPLWTVRLVPPRVNVRPLPVRPAITAMAQSVSTVRRGVPAAAVLLRVRRAVPGIS